MSEYNAEETKERVLAKIQMQWVKPTKQDENSLMNGFAEICRGSKEEFNKEKKKREKKND